MRQRGSVGSIALALAVAALALGGCGDKNADPTHESSEIRRMSFPVSAAPKLEIAASNGVVTVRGQDGLAEIQVMMMVRNRGNSLRQAEDRVHQMVVHADQEEDRLVLRYDAAEQSERLREYGSVDFEVVTPVRTELSVALHNGAVSIEALESTVTLALDNGRIIAADIAGALDARTDNGTIDVERIHGAMKIDTSNGRIRMAEVNGTVDAETCSGDVRFSGRLADAAHRIKTARGDLDIELPLDLSIMIDATASGGIEAQDLGLAERIEGREWLYALNPPVGATLELLASSGRITLRGMQK